MSKREIFIERLRDVAVESPTEIVSVPDKVEGFGTIVYKSPMCSACKKCIEVCDVEALDIEMTLGLPEFMSATIPDGGFRSKNREALVSLLQELGQNGDVQAVSIPFGLPGYGAVMWDADKCIACNKCVNICPEECLTLEKEYNLPLVIGEVKPVAPVEVTEWEPFIVCFVCWECSHAAADLAGLMHLHYPANIRTIRVPCSGAVEPMHIMTAMQKGADGVLVTGCLLSECHYGGDDEIAGNFMQYDFIQFWNSIFAQIGLEGRLHIDFASAAMGFRFAEIVEEFVRTIEKLGPSPLRGKTKEDS
ncbi:MAG: hydrogenase iron-sulfur subunit [Candidatus Thorarchaeota archaeon]|jgi:coenzyme F420-reducing hydrogenase delta subunit/NAD-dependent dihydropyrimidine dehydrogenase PreA subunit